MFRIYVPRWDYTGEIKLMFFVTAFFIRPDDSPKPTDRYDPDGDHRCFGYFADKKKAIEAVEGNWGDMHECLYNHLVIEEIPEGIHAMPKNVLEHKHERWYSWQGDSDTGKWTRCLRPIKFKQIIMFSL